MDAAIDRLCEGLNRLVDHPQYLKDLTNFPHLKITL